MTGLDCIMEKLDASFNRVIEKFDVSFQRFSQEVSEALAVSWIQTLGF